MKRVAREGIGQLGRQGGQLGGWQYSGRREGSVLTCLEWKCKRCEAPLKKESTGLSGRLAKAEGGPEMQQAREEHWGGACNSGDLGKGSSVQERLLACRFSLQSSETARALVIVLSRKNSIHLEEKGNLWGKGGDCWRMGHGPTSSNSQEL